jgi:DNA-binding HxlR family transcriptional regulator
MPSDPTDEWQRTWHHLQRALGNKWALHVLHVLADDPATFTGLHEAIAGVSETVLSRRLSELREAGFLERSTRASTPPRAEYRLTAGGERVARFLDEMESVAAVSDREDGPRLVFEP